VLTVGNDRTGKLWLEILLIMIPHVSYPTHCFQYVASIKGAFATQELTWEFKIPT